MAFVEETSNTPSGGGVRWFLPEGPTIAVASTVDFSGCNGAITFSGIGTVDTINGTEPGEFFLVRAATGSAVTLSTAGNIAIGATLTPDAIYMLWNNGGVLYLFGQLPAGNPPFTPYGHIAALTMQEAIEELVDEKVDLANLTEDTTPLEASDFILTWDTSAGAYKKVKPSSFAYLKKAGDTMVGKLLLPNGTAGAPPLAASGSTGTGVFFDSANHRVLFSCGGTAEVMIDSNQLNLDSGGYLGWSTTSDPTGTSDIAMIRGGARRLDILANGTNAAELRILFDGTTKSKMLSLSVDGSGNPTVRAIAGNLFLVGDSGYVVIANSGGSIFGFTSGLMYPETTNTHSIGTTSLALKDIYVAGSIQATRTKALTEGGTTAFVRIACPINSHAGGHIDYSIVAHDGASQRQVRTGTLYFSIVRGGGAHTFTLGRGQGSTVVDGTTDIVAVTGGTLTNTFAAASAADAVDINASATCSFVQTVLNIEYRVVITSGTATVTPL